MADEVKKQVEETKEEVGFYRSCGLPEPVEKIHEVDVGDHIVQHYTHSFDKTGKVIVVEGEKEDLWESIPQYQDQVGPKNVIRMIEAGGDPFKLLDANKQNAFYGDVTEMTADSINELGVKAQASASAADKALKEFNDKFGTSLSMKEFLDLSSKGLLNAHVEGVNQVKDGVSDGKE